MSTTTPTAPSATTGQPRRRSPKAIAAVAVVSAVLLLAGCFSANQNKVVDLVNGSRKANRKAAVVGEQKAMDKAQAWAERMARTGKVEHTGGGSKIDPSGLPKWCAIGENVGQGTSLQNIHDTWMNSAVHKANILGPYNKVGTGVVRKGSVVYAVQIFYRSC